MSCHWVKGPADVSRCPFLSTWPVARQASIGATPTRIYASDMIVLGLTTYVVRIATTEASARSRWAVGTASCTDLVER